VNTADRSAATVRRASGIGCRIARRYASVNDFVPDAIMAKDRWRRARISRRRSLRVPRADRSTATIRNACRMGRRMAGSSAHVNDFLLGRDNGEGVLRTQ
jgi:hypothetical protein